MPRRRGPSAMLLLWRQRHLCRQHYRIRAALDIGSGQHKLLVAKVDASGRLVQKLHSEQQQVLLNHDLVQSSASSPASALSD